MLLTQTCAPSPRRPALALALRLRSDSTSSPPPSVSVTCLAPRAAAYRPPAPTPAPSSSTWLPYRRSAWAGSPSQLQSSETAGQSLPPAISPSCRTERK
eukprot:scaffold189313_cov40-Tisochrysis_lutea.AAC.1